MRAEANDFDATAFGIVVGMHDMLIVGGNIDAIDHGQTVIDFHDLLGPGTLLQPD
jgi:hypothetical protein